MQTIQESTHRLLERSRSRQFQGATNWRQRAQSLQALQGSHLERRFPTRHEQQAVERDRESVRDSIVMHKRQLHTEESLHQVPASV